MDGSAPRGSGPDRGVTTVVTDTAPAPIPTTTDVPDRRRAALRLALRRYARELRRRPALAAGALLLPALGAVFVRYLPPLVVAELVGRLATGGTAPSSVDRPRPRLRRCCCSSEVCGASACTA